MGRTGVKMPELEQYTQQVNRMVQLINGEPGLSPEEKKSAIKNLEGLSREKMIEYTRIHFGRGNDLAARLIVDSKPKKGLFTKKK